MKNIRFLKNIAVFLLVGVQKQALKVKFKLKCTVKGELVE